MKWALFFVSVCAASAAGLYFLMIDMPGASYSAGIPSPTSEQTAAALRMRNSVKVLTEDIGERSVRVLENLAKASAWLNHEFAAMGYRVTRQSFKTDSSELSMFDVPCENIIAEKVGTSLPAEILIVGAHYDSLAGTVGADDNASGVAAVLELARRFAKSDMQRTVRFAAFVNEEPPFFRSKYMGSLRYAEKLKGQRENVVGMLSVETIGFYSEEPNSQDYPDPFSFIYPDKGNFIGIVGDLSSRSFVREVVRTFRLTAQIPSQAGAIFSFVPGIGSSDHWAFWQYDYPGVMVTDTAPYRYPHYHRKTDTTDKLNFAQMALVVDGLESVIQELAGETQ